MTRYGRVNGKGWLEVMNKVSLRDVVRTRVIASSHRCHLNEKKGKHAPTTAHGRDHWTIVDQQQTEAPLSITKQQKGHSFPY
jgi:hypothetical protein